MDLLLTSGLPWATILWTIFLDEVMIVSGLVGALVSTRYKWGFYTLGCAAMFSVFWHLAFEGRKRAYLLGHDVGRTYLICGVGTLFIWLLYPIAWGVSEGGNVIPPDSEAVFYGLLDLCAKPFFSIMLIAGHWKIDPARMGLRLKDYNQEPHYFDTPSGAGREKHAGATAFTTSGPMSTATQTLVVSSTILTSQCLRPLLVSRPSSNSCAELRSHWRPLLHRAIAKGPGRHREKT